MRRTRRRGQGRGGEECSLAEGWQNSEGSPRVERAQELRAFATLGGGQVQFQAPTW